MSENSFPSEEWGLCRECRWWQIEPDVMIKNDTIGACIDEELQPYKISVTATSGCAMFSRGTPARAAGSSRQPPEAKPTR